MVNKYGIPEGELEKIRARDVICVYCHKLMDNAHIEVKRTNWTTIEHLNHLPPWNNPATVAICCHECNSRRGKKTLMEWFKSPYCIERNINEKTVAEPVKEYIKKAEKQSKINSMKYKTKCPKCSTPIETNMPGTYDCAMCGQKIVITA